MRFEIQGSGFSCYCLACSKAPRLEFGLGEFGGSRRLGGTWRFMGS